MSGSAGSALRRAQDDSFEHGVRLGSLELQQAVDSPSVSVGAPGGALAALVKGVAMIAPLGGVLAPLGGSGADVFSGTGALDPATERAIVLLCFWLAAVGQAWALVDWWRLGRPRDGNGVAAAALAVAAAGVAAWWHLTRADPASVGMLLAPILLTGVLGAVGLVARLVGSRRDTVQDIRRAALGERLRTLPADEQRAMLSERAEILAALRSRGLIDDAQAQRAAAARLGDWWLVDRERDRR